MTAYCTCRYPPGYVSLRDELNTFVCGECHLPSWMTYLASERFCEECGCSIFTLWEVLCAPCRTAILTARQEGHAWALAFNLDPHVRNGGILAPDWIGWSEARTVSLETWPWRWAA